MRIIQLFKVYWPDNAGGIAKVMEDVSQSFHAYNQRIIVCGRKNAGKTYWDQYHGIKVLRCRQLADICSTPLSIDFIRYAGCCISDSDVVVYHFPYPIVDLAVRLHRIRGRLIVWWHCDIASHKYLLPIYERLIRNTLEQAERIVVSSHGILKHSRYLQKYRDKCRVIPFCIDGRYIEKGKKAFSSQPEKKEILILFIGRLVWYKGCQVLLKAFAKMKHENCRLTVAGTGPLADELKRMSAQMHIAGQVCFEGRVSEKRKQMLLEECDFLVLPSISKAEAFGIVQIEAMAFGKPVINTAVPSGVPEVSIHGVTGITTAPGSVDELSDAMELLAGNARLRRIYGKNAIRRVSEQYTQERMYEECLKLIQELE